MVEHFEPAIFRMYDIRGKADTQVTPDLAHAVGRALGTRIRRQSGTTAAIGRDVRHSSPRLLEQAARGLAESGLEVLILGQVPTPVLYHALHRMELSGGIMVTGSHNPREDNGLKMCLGNSPIYGEEIQSLYRQILAGDLEKGSGLTREWEYLPRYLEEICGKFSFTGLGPVAVDCGNGVMGPVVERAFANLGVKTIPLYFQPDGDFPNHIPDPEVPEYMEALARAVNEKGAVCGLGFDGDGDRLGVLDEKGNKISADLLLALFSRHMLQEFPGGKVRYDVKCSDFLEDDIRQHGGEPILGKTGHSLLKKDVVEMDAILGGELSGHIVFNRGYLPIDDSLFNALHFLDLLQNSGQPASELFADFPATVSTPEIKVPCPDDKKFSLVDNLVREFSRRFPVNTVDGARVRLENGSWFLVRASNTTPNLTVRIEAPTKNDLLAARDVLLTALADYPEADRTILKQKLPA